MTFQLTNTQDIGSLNAEQRCAWFHDTVLRSWLTGSVSGITFTDWTQTTSDFTSWGAGPATMLKVTRRSFNKGVDHEQWYLYQSHDDISAPTPSGQINHFFSYGKTDLNVSAGVYLGSHNMDDWADQVNLYVSDEDDTVWFVLAGNRIVAHSMGNDFYYLSDEGTNWEIAADLFHKNFNLTTVAVAGTGVSTSTDQVIIPWINSVRSGASESPFTIDVLRLDVREITSGDYQQIGVGSKPDMRMFIEPTSATTLEMWNYSCNTVLIGSNYYVGQTQQNSFLFDLGTTNPGI